MAITLVQAQTQLQLWLDADAAVAKKQEYRIAGRSWTYADASAITEKIDYWSRKVGELSGNSPRNVGRIFPC